ncbi:MAG: Fic family protein [Candidatus Hadarchaeota archaeon]
MARNYLDNLKLTPAHAASLLALGEYKGKQELFTRRSPEALLTMQKLAMIESTVSSNRLEGITVEDKRARDIVLKSAKPRERSEQEVAGYRDALALIHGSAKDMPFTTETVRQLHATIYRFLPKRGGNWKTNDNIIVERYPNGTGKVRFKPVPAAMTADAMAHLVTEYEAVASREEPMVVIPLAILDFLCIHPFEDGNGRVARLLTLLLLYRAGYNVGRYISLERIIEESKESYYEALEKSSRGWHEGRHDVFPWLTYFWGTLLRAYKEFEERVGSVTKRGAKTEQVELAIKRKTGPFSISDIENDCPGISRDMIRVVLNKLRKAGKIRLTNRGRDAKWAAA